MGNKHIRLLLTDVSYRAKASLCVSFTFNSVYAALKLFSGIYYASFWYGADALYYIILSGIRLFLLRRVPKDERNPEKEFREYRFCGYLLMAMNVALIGVVFQIVYQGREYRYPGLMIYAVAFYAFFCIITSAVNAVKYRKFNNPVLSAIKNISLVKAYVAMFALQSAMIASFSSGDDDTFKNMMNGIAGIFVCLGIFSMAVYMIVKANKNLTKAEAQNIL
jgi:divalent metal cation (Fe/Co/Zn/Cd) transporter